MARESISIVTAGIGMTETSNCLVAVSSLWRQLFCSRGSQVAGLLRDRDMNFI